ncbi:MAG: right-handed parallel beta-helix repeat-containing protein [Rubripirellula sp.]|nr:right-handed parallel beta-helix repeat-containing protein [Rubripirellula sp.]
MHKTIIALVACCMSIGLPTLCVGKTYHVAPYGNDSNPGSLDLPCKTIQHVALLMQAGDTCTIHGGTYRETVRPKVSGTRERPIHFVAAAGDKVVITGTELVQGNWVEHDEEILKTKIRFKSIPQILARERLMLQARWPNAHADNLLEIERGKAAPGTDYEGVVAPLRPSGDLRGATILLWPGHAWDNACRVVTKIAGEKLIFGRDFRPDKADVLHGFDPFKPKESNHFLLYGSLSLLDSPGEWFFDEAAKTLYWKRMPGIQPTELEIRVRTHGFQLTSLSHISIQGINLVGCGFDLRGASNCVIRRCTTQYSDYPRPVDIYHNPDLTNIVTGRANRLEHCTFAYTALSGLTVNGINNTLTDCLIHTNNYLGAHKASVDAANSQGLKIQYCTIRGAGRELIHFKKAKRLSILYCDLSDANRLSNDTGALKCWGTDGEGSVIAYNWVHDNQGRNTVGIYLDNYSKNFSVHHNVIWNNSGAGIRLNSPSNDNQIYNNTLLGNGKSFAVFTYRGKIPNQSGTKVYHNLYSGELQFVEGNFAPEVRGNVFVKAEPLLSPSPSNMVLERIAKENLPAVTSPGTASTASAIGAYEAGKPFWKPGPRDP